MIEDAAKVGALKGFDDKAGFLSMVDKQIAKVDKQTEEAAEDKTRVIIWNEKVAGLQKQYDDSCDVWQKAINESYTREMGAKINAETAAEEAAEEEAHYRRAK